MSIPLRIWIPDGIVIRMSKETRADKVVRDTADEIRREARAASSEVRSELLAAKRETADALREAMDEIRAAFGEVWGPAGGQPPAEPGARLSRLQRKELTRELLLDAAIDVFAERGYHGASLDDVADAAGFTKGAVYSNFTRKSDLFRALLERETRRRTAALRGAVEAVPLALLPDVVGELIRQPDADQRDRDILAVEFWLAAVRDPDLRLALVDATGGYGDVLEHKLAAAGARPGLTGRELAALLEALATGLRMRQALDPAGNQHVLFTMAVHKLIADELPDHQARGHTAAMDSEQQR
jgi:AcrR family transcriptional regulator